jgi:hypothetical protein
MPWTNTIHLFSSSGAGTNTGDAGINAGVVGVSNPAAKDSFVIGMTKPPVGVVIYGKLGGSP